MLGVLKYNNGDPPPLNWSTPIVRKRRIRLVGEDHIHRYAGQQAVGVIDGDIHYLGGVSAGFNTQYRLFWWTGGHRACGR